MEDKIRNFNEEGKDKATVQNIIQLMTYLNDSVNKVMDILQISNEKRERYKEKINQKSIL